MSDESTLPVTKEEALKIIAEHIDRPGVVIDLQELIQLLTWQAKLMLWLLQDKATSNPIKQKS